MYFHQRMDASYQPRNHSFNYGALMKYSTSRRKMFKSHRARNYSNVFIIFILISTINNCIAESGSSYVSDQAIANAVEQCCPPQMVKCCKQHLRRDSVITCGPNPQTALRAAICLEHFFYNDSIIATGAHECCWMLSTDQCRHKCSRNLCKPTLPHEEKFTFTDDCPRVDLKDGVDWRRQYLNAARELMKSYKNSKNRELSTAAAIAAARTSSTPLVNNEDEDEENDTSFDCLWQTKYKLHDCFSSCLAWMRKKTKASEQKRIGYYLSEEQESIGSIDARNEQEEYNPRLHCAEYQNFVKENPCFFVIEK